MTVHVALDPAIVTPGLCLRGDTLSVAVKLRGRQDVDSLVEVGAQLYPWLPVRWLTLDTYESGAFASLITVPTTIIAAEHDEVIPRASTEKLLSRFKPGVARMTVIEGVDHNNVGANTTYREVLQAALQ